MAVGEANLAVERFAGSQRNKRVQAALDAVKEYGPDALRHGLPKAVVVSLLMILPTWVVRETAKEIAWPQTLEQTKAAREAHPSRGVFLHPSRLTFLGRNVDDVPLYGVPALFGLYFGAKTARKARRERKQNDAIRRKEEFIQDEIIGPFNDLLKMRPVDQEAAEALKANIVRKAIARGVVGSAEEILNNDTFIYYSNIAAGHHSYQSSSARLPLVQDDSIEAIQARLLAEKAKREGRVDAKEPEPDN